MTKCSWWEWVAYLAIVLLAAFLRVVHIDRIPPGLWYDEAIYALDGLSVAQGEPRIFYDTYGHMREPLYIWSLGAFFRIFGHSTEKARIVSALWGTAAVALLFPLARHLFTVRWALLACLGLAAFRWHLHFSRTIFRALLPSLFIIAVVWLFLRWRERRRLADAAWCGIVLGAGMYTYLSFRLVPLIVGVGLLWMLWRRELLLRRDWKQLALLAVTTLIVFLPLGVDYLRHPEHFSGRTSEITLFEKKVETTQPDGSIRQETVRKTIAEVARDAGSNAWAIRKMWTWRGDHVGKHNLPHEPVFDWANGLVFFLGIVGCVYYFKGNVFCVLLLAWLFIMSLTSTFSFGAPNLLRMQGASPAAVLIYVFGLKLLYELLQKRVSVIAARIVAGALFCLFCAVQLHTYFVKFSKSIEVRRDFTADVFYEPARAVLAIADRYPRVLVPRELAESPTFKFVTAGLSNIEPYPPEGPEMIPHSRPVAMLVTVRSLDLARQEGQDMLASIRGARGTLLRKMDLPIQQAPDGTVLSQPWAELWAIPPSSPRTEAVQP